MGCARGKSGSGCAVQRRILAEALKRSTLDHGVFPTTEQGLEVLVRKLSVGGIPRNGPEGGYLAKPEVPKDPWDNASIYPASRIRVNFHRTMPTRADRGGMPGESCGATSG